jgi:starch-binding outer membrane protein, SusD/RagB family
MKRINLYIVSIIAAFTTTFVSCTKLDITPPNEILSSVALNTTADYQNLLNSAYSSTANALGGNDFIFNELLSDNLDMPLNNNDFNEIYNHNTLFFNGTIGSFYNSPYEAVFRANYLMEHANDKGILSPSDKSKMMAECKFLRALAHFEIVKLFAQPYGYTADNSHLGIIIKKISTPAPLPRNTVKEVYDFIIADLKDAINGLPASNGNYASVYAAKALLAKVYFGMSGYPNNFALAAQYADDVISNGGFIFNDSGNVFTTDTTGRKEVIFTIASLNSTDNHAGGFTSNYRCDGGKIPQLRVSADLYTLATSDTADKRANYYQVFNKGQANQYIGYTKFNADYFNVPYLHLTDMKLIRAEALAESGGSITTAVKDVNDIIKRAYGASSSKLLPISSAASDVITSARYERRLEMVGEGDRVFQLKRIGAKGELINGNQVKIRKAPWNCPGMVLQFPIAEKTSIFIMNETGGCN